MTQQDNKKEYKPSLLKRLSRQIGCFFLGHKYNAGQDKETGNPVAVCGICDKVTRKMPVKIHREFIPSKNEVVEPFDYGGYDALFEELHRSQKRFILRFKVVTILLTVLFTYWLLSRVNGL